MKNKKLMLMILILISFPLCGLAYQSKPANDNETLSFRLSKDDYSRIVVQGDRIAAVKGQTSLYELREFKGDGEIFIRPTEFAKETISIFITTELGHHYTLRLKISNVTAENIEIKPASAIDTLALKWEKNNAYTETLVDLLKAMVNGEVREGYATILLDKNKPIQLTPTLTMRLLKLYRGSALLGEIWQVTNCSPKFIQLKPQLFYNNTVRAVSFSQEKLNPNESTYLYRIVNHE